MLKELIDSFYSSHQEDRDKNHFYITDAGKCPRATYFGMKKYPKKAYDPRILRTFDHGDYTHMRLMAVLFSMGIVRAAEIGIPKQEIINGRADAIISIDNKNYVLEIKSMNMRSFEKLEKPDPDHLKQLQFYLHYFKIPQGIIIYENKNTQDLKEFVVNYDEKLVASLLKDFEKLKVQIDSSIIPDIPADINDWRCEYCNYAEECEKVEEEKRESSA